MARARCVDGGSGVAEVFTRTSPSRAFYVRIIIYTSLPSTRVYILNSSVGVVNITHTHTQLCVGELGDATHQLSAAHERSILCILSGDGERDSRSTVSAATVTASSAAKTRWRT